MVDTLIIAVPLLAIVYLLAAHVYGEPGSSEKQRLNNPHPGAGVAAVGYVLGTILVLWTAYEVIYLDWLQR